MYDDEDNILKRIELKLDKIMSAMEIPEDEESDSWDDSDYTDTEDEDDK
jgi:hypothetical protein|tara:strand:- start:415 stop:561 length:147 start_codon:yes stop_codon:yes gene_type:complete